MSHLSRPDVIEIVVGTSSLYRFAHLTSSGAALASESRRKTGRGLGQNVGAFEFFDTSALYVAP
jgi:hypothetical protein